MIKLKLANDEPRENQTIELAIITRFFACPRDAWIQTCIPLRARARTLADQKISQKIFLGDFRF